uniref:Uncharacterized protein n=1 Tax=Corvus moneduloides TaxID=1196302 RepID=A0A8U7LZJ6_CORMO
MADEEAERESGGPGGDLLELRRLRERLLELETGLRESREPAVQAATEYCKQLCQLGLALTRGLFAGVSSELVTLLSIPS